MTVVEDVLGAYSGSGVLPDLRQNERLPSLKSLELFTGAGGLALGTHAVGFQHVALIEWARTACNTLRTNVALQTLPGIDDWTVLETDVQEVSFADFAPVDLVAGGPPCQPFSVGGRHRGHDDDRNMIPQFIRAIRELKPRAFIMENVRGLLRPSFMPYYNYVIRELSYPTISRHEYESWSDHMHRIENVHLRGPLPDLRYRVSYHLVNAADYGVPQLRWRVFVVGFRSDVETDWTFPTPTHSQRSLERSQWISGDYWERHNVRRPNSPPGFAATRARLLATGELMPLLPWNTVRDAIHDLPQPLAGQDTPHVHNHRLQPGARAYPGHTGSILDWPSKALKAGVHGVPGGENMLALPDGAVRYMTGREAARIQTFPDEWVFEGPWTEILRQLGNAVPMRLATTVARSVAERLESLKEHERRVRPA